MALPIIMYWQVCVQLLPITFNYYRSVTKDLSGIFRLESLALYLNIMTLFNNGPQREVLFYEIIFIQ